MRSHLGPLQFLLNKFFNSKALKRFIEKMTRIFQQEEQEQQQQQQQLGPLLDPALPQVKKEPGREFLLIKPVSKQLFQLK